MLVVFCFRISFTFCKCCRHRSDVVTTSKIFFSECIVTEIVDTFRKHIEACCSSIRATLSISFFIHIPTTFVCIECMPQSFATRSEIFAYASEYRCCVEFMNGHKSLALVHACDPLSNALHILHLTARASVCVCLCACAIINRFSPLLM